MLPLATRLSRKLVFFWGKPLLALTNAVLGQINASKGILADFLD